MSQTIVTIEQEPKKAERKKFRKMLLKGLGYCLLSAVTTGGIAAIATGANEVSNNSDNIGYDYNQDGDITQADYDYFKNLVVAYPAKLEATEAKIASFSQIYGEACVKAVQPYENGQVLASTSEDSVLSDLARDHDTSCGSTVTAERTAVHDMRTAQDALHEVAKFNYNGRIAELQRINDRIAADRAFVEPFFWIPLMSSAGFIGAAGFSVAATRISRKSKARRAANDAKYDRILFEDDDEY